jgi:hypothetical protein
MRGRRLSLIAERGRLRRAGQCLEFLDPGREAGISSAIFLFKLWQYPLRIILLILGIWLLINILFVFVMGSPRSRHPVRGHPTEDRPRPNQPQ